MELAAAAGILEFYGQIDLFLVVFVRFIGFFLLFPIFSGETVPAPVKLFIALSFAIIIVSAGIVTLPSYEDNIFGYFGLIIIEFITGFTVGFTIYVFMSAFLLAGQLMDFQIGFSMVSVFDPISQIQVPITGNLYYLVMSALFIRTGSLDYFIYQLTESFAIIPVGQAFIIGNNGLLYFIISAIIKFVEIGVKISIPVVGTIIVVDVVLGILVKAVPQMNVFVVGMPLKVFIGLIVLYLIAPFLGDVYTYVIENLMKYTYNIIRGMAPYA